MDYAHKDAQIEVSGRVPDIREAFSGAHILLAPVFSGKVTRYKILEAMASGTPIIATGIAVEGLGVKNGEEVLIANDAQTMADTALSLLDDQNLQKKLSRRGQTFVSQNFDWDLIAQKLDEVYLKFAKKEHLHD